MGLHSETAVGVCALRETQLPAGSWEAGDENGCAVEVLIQETGDGGKLPKTTVTGSDHRAEVAKTLALKPGCITEACLDEGTSETHSYRFRRYDAIEKTVHVYLCTVTDSTTPALSDSYKWVPWDNWEAHLTYPHGETCRTIKQTMRRGLDRMDNPFTPSDDTQRVTGAQHRKLKRKATADKINAQHQSLDEFE